MGSRVEQAGAGKAESPIGGDGYGGCVYGGRQPAVPLRIDLRMSIAGH